MTSEILEVAAAPEKVGEVRRWARKVLESLPDGIVDDLVLLLTEVVTNSIEHSASRRGGLVTVQLTAARTHLRCEVTDGGGDTCPQLLELADAEHGRGLLIVDRISARWGSREVTGGGTLTWFELGRGAARLLPLLDGSGIRGWGARGGEVLSGGQGRGRVYSIWGTGVPLP
ncbi:ATP-binding protein [Actinocorallia longicatena]|uniref:Histidine kinase/HSP90-like ATPase domain-containing protein n=1 Tax=Actinocorallia longicatena TaxID=111803 RepID=A0ABP6QNZ7_9ACTN